jgi:hypothetical protein
MRHIFKQPRPRECNHRFKQFKFSERNMSRTFVDNNNNNNNTSTLKYECLFATELLTYRTDFFYDKKFENAYDSQLI